MKTLTRYLLVACLPLLLIACEREAPQPVDQLPPATQEGANTFGCLVDGELWLPESDSWLDVPWTASFYQGTLFIKAKNASKPSAFSFELLDRVHSEGTYVLLHEPWNGGQFIRFSEGESVYRPDSTHFGYLTITKLDTSEPYFVSGTFYFDAVNENDSTDIVQITDGRFDLKF